MRAPLSSTAPPYTPYTQTPPPSQKKRLSPKNSLFNTHKNNAIKSRVFQSLLLRSADSQVCDETVERGYHEQR